MLMCTGESGMVERRDEGAGNPVEPLGIIAPAPLLPNRDKSAGHRVSRGRSRVLSSKDWPVSRTQREILTR